MKRKKSTILKQEKVSDPNVLSFDEIYKWIRAQEGPPSFVAVKDGKLKDGTQLYSIGLGHQIQPNESELLSSRISEQQVLDIFKKDIEKILASMDKAIKVPINKNQKLALLSLRYNIGESAFNNSTLLKLLNSRDAIGASEEFQKWRLSEGLINKGLIARRERERQLYLKPI